MKYDERADPRDANVLVMISSDLRGLLRLQLSRFYSPDVCIPPSRLNESPTPTEQEMHGKTSIQFSESIRTHENYT